MAGALMTAECRVCRQVKEGPVPVGEGGQVPGGAVIQAGKTAWPFVCFGCLKSLEPRRLVFFPDWGADPVWVPDRGMVSLDELPVSDQTRRETREWATRWEQMAKQEMAADAFAAGMATAPAESVSQQDRDALERDGRAVWLRLRDDLGDEWVVGWASFPDTGREVEWSPGTSPEPLPFQDRG